MIFKKLCVFVTAIFSEESNQQIVTISERANAYVKEVYFPSVMIKPLF